MSDLKITKHWLKDWMDKCINELAEECAEADGELSHAYYYKEAYKKKGEFDTPEFKEYCMEAYDEYEKAIESQEFIDWIRNDKSKDIEEWCAGDIFFCKDTYETAEELFIEDNDVELVYEFLNRK